MEAIGFPQVGCRVRIGLDGVGKCPVANVAAQRQEMRRSDLMFVHAEIELFGSWWGFQGSNLPTERLCCIAELRAGPCFDL